jgi:glutamate--cysteine ligase regulatory subunit
MYLWPIATITNHISSIIPGILLTESFQKVIGDLFTARDSEGWEPQWMARYSCVIKGRGVIRSKGYIMKAARDLKKIK